jgi:hydroxypyruvate isomerase
MMQGTAKLKFSANLSTLFQELPLRERFAAAARAGFDAVEIWFPYDLPVAEMRELLGRNNQRCVAINSPAGNVAQGDWGLAVDPARRDEFDRSIETAMSYAQAIDCPCVHVMAGQVSGEACLARAWERYLASVATACDVADTYGRTVMIEPLNAIDRPRYLLSTQAQALDVLEDLRRGNLKLMLDVFHLQRGEGNLIERLRRSLPYAAHVQIADNPGRHEPGTGEINFAAVFDAIARSGYQDYIGCEYIPSRATTESFHWLSELVLVDASSDSRLERNQTLP